ncbi:NAD(P)-dependent oxidoreductase [Streptomyces sp. NRRL B-1347]|uniref:NAD(P)-dependent oxidoreductase n=1 Tax=Streptomyces sp. NRRL B-1347 TaxID=1476877 RepID=UPI0004C68EEA|nr:NAD(P)-binding domain-containing protein [Streptomyces sp. NRRL B-1347]
MTNHAAATTSSPSPVTVVGLGPMGLVLAEALLSKGHPTTVWNRTPERASGLVARGASLAGSIADAVSASPVTIMCLNTYDTMYEVFGPAGDALRGRVLVNLNSGTPQEVRTAVTWASGLGVRYLDGAVMVPPPLVGRPDAVFLYSGDRAVLDEHRATLASLGDPRFLGTDPTLAVLYNTALLHMMYATLNGYLHATALVGSAGVSAVEFAGIALGWFMPAVLDPSSLAPRAADLDEGNYPGALGTLRMNVNALEHIARASEEQGVHSELPRLMREVAERAVSQGHGDDNYFSVHELFKRPSPAS